MFRITVKYLCYYVVLLYSDIMKLSPLQRETLKSTGKLLDEFGCQRWFTQFELPGITLHTMKALVDKGFLYCKESETNGYLYYRQIEPQNEEEKEYWVY